MGIQQLVDSTVKAIVICCVFGALCICHSLARPLSSADIGLGLPADVGIAIAAPLVEGRVNNEAPKLGGKGKVKNAAVSYLFFL